jgi:hypothetical protein
MPSKISSALDSSSRDRDALASRLAEIGNQLKHIEGEQRFLMVALPNESAQKRLSAMNREMSQLVQQVI